jgi:hypothetical protein
MIKQVLSILSEAKDKGIFKNSTMGDSVMR